MHNSEIPTRAELPSTARLIKSTILALVAAAAILIAVVLPAEYAIDPTGIGRLLKLTRMGEIKRQLAIEAEADRIRDQQQKTPATPDRRSAPLTGIVQLLVRPAAAQGLVQVAQAASPKSDETVVTLRPNEGVEYKLTMTKGAKVEYAWRSAGGGVNYDLHGSPAGGGKEKSYKQGRASEADSGTFVAPFDGQHGWFWRNRTSRDVTITLKTNGIYEEIRRVH